MILAARALSFGLGSLILRDIGFGNFQALPSNNDELDLRRLAPDERPDVDGEDGWRRVEDRRQRRHQRRQHHRQHHPAEP